MRIWPIVLVTLLLFTVCKPDLRAQRAGNNEPIRVGVLHSVTGTMSFSEQSVIEATMLAIEEINAAGGVNRRQLVPILRDGASDGETFARKARILIEEDKVDVIFGCWTSASRKSVLPVITEHNHLLFYPVQYEGMEQSPNIVYTGSAPNQQIIPAINWMRKRYGEHMFLVGSDYVFPHAANAIIRDQLTSVGGSIAGEAYVLLGDTLVSGIIDEILASGADVIVNTLNGDSNIAFYEALRARGVTPSHIPSISFSITQTEYQIMGEELLKGDYLAWTYFQQIDSEANQKFISAFRNRYGADRVVTDPMEAAYIGVHLWARAAAITRSTDPVSVRSVIGGLSMAAPQGPVSVETRNQHLWKSVYIGRFAANDDIDILWSSPKPVRPLPFPPYRPRQSWEYFLQGLYESWGGAWTNPGITEAQP